MPKSNSGSASIEKWNAFSRELKGRVPHLSAFMLDNSDFVELRLKARDDGTVLGIAKGYALDGSPVVAFGVGYDSVLALMALDNTIQGNHWRKDKPWQPGK